MTQIDSDLGSDGGNRAQPGSPHRGAYLVLRHAGRWSDVFRLSPPQQAVIGRASSNQIVTRSEQASRQHARIEWSDRGWLLEDLGSRNGTYLNGQRITESPSLSDGDVIQIAGFAIVFTAQIEGGIGSPVAAAGSSSQATDDQITMGPDDAGFDASSITDRRQRSSYLHKRVQGGRVTERGTQAGEAIAAGAATSRRLLQLAFALARCDQPAAAVDQTLQTLAEQIQFDTAGIYVAPVTGSAESSIEDIPLAATRQTGSRSYRRPPKPLLDSVAGADGQAVLARNILGDQQLATENSRGEIDVESVIVAPIRDHQKRLRGFVHLTTAVDATPLAGDDLEFTVAACEILGESLFILSDRRQLSQSLQARERQIKALQERLGNKVRIVGKSKAIGDVIQQIELAAPTHATVLIRGESGVGKELVAAALHHASDRKNGPLICLNCAALSPTLLESELFGHEKGAFTGATDRKTGKFEAADGGTLMLDEIGEMSGEVQAKFLRVLEGHPFERVGGHQSIRVDVRVIAATNRDLQAMVREGTFRQDLYYRLHVVEIVVPPLRQREKDCVLLAEFFLRQFNQEMGRKIDGFTDAARKQLTGYSWPGNIRELKNVIERAVVLNTKGVIDASDLALSPALEESGTATVEVSPQLSLAELEQQHIERVLRHTEGNKSQAAAILGIERSTLDRKLKRFAKKNR